MPRGLLIKINHHFFSINIVKIWIFVLFIIFHSWFYYLQPSFRTALLRKSAERFWTTPPHPFLFSPVLFGSFWFLWAFPQQWKFWQGCFHLRKQTAPVTAALYRQERESSKQRNKEWELSHQKHNTHNTAMPCPSNTEGPAPIHVVRNFLSLQYTFCITLTSSVYDTG